MKEPVLALRGVNKFFIDAFSLENIDLDLRAGEVHMILGENGSGKTALMQMIAGLHRKDTGTMTFEGRVANFANLHAAKNAGIVLQHQDPQLYGNLSIAENIFFADLPRMVPILPFTNPWRLHSDCVSLLTRLGIGMDPETMVSQLGFSQRLLVSALRTLVSRAKVVIFDEPTAGMTDPERAILFNIVRELKGQGVGILYVTHKFDEIREIGDRASILHKGRMVATRERGHLEHGELIRFMSGKVKPERYPKIPIDPGRTVLEVEHLKSTHVLRDISFSLHAGEILGITGLMGSGRTRLAHILFGVESPDGGSIRLEGRERTFSHPAEALDAGIALVPEDRTHNAVFPLLDIEGNMSVASLERFQNGMTLDTPLMRGVVEEYVSRLGIRPDHASLPMHGYSGGNQQKMVIARWLMSRCSIYILDEPTRGVDIATRVDVYNSINDLVSKGAAVIFLSSEIEEILGMCDRILVLAGGVIACDLPRTAASKELILEYAASG